MSTDIGKTERGQTSTMKISLKRGIECFFDVGDATVRVWASAWTGREVVELNGQVVSDKRSLKLSTPHRFTHDGHDYEVVFQISSLLSGLFEVFLYRNGKLLDSDQGRHQSIPVNHETGQVDWRRYGLQIFLWTMAGGVVGGIFGFLVASLTKGAGA